MTTDWRVIMNFASSPFYFGVNKNRPDLLTELNLAQKQILEENPFYNEEVHDRYMKSISLSTTNLSDDEKSWLKQHNDKVRIGYLEGYQPLSYQDETGSFAGVAADLLSKMEEQYGDDGLHFEAVPYKNQSEMMDALNRGEISAAWPVYSDYWNADQNNIALTEQLVTSSMMLVFDGEYHENRVSKIGVLSNGSFTDLYAKIYYPDSEIVTYDSYEEAVSAAAKDEVSSILYTAVTYNVDVEKNDTLKQLSTYMLPKGFGASMATAQQDCQLVSILNKGLVFIGGDGVDQSLIQHSAVNKEVSLKDYFEQNPLVANGLIFVCVMVLAGLILFSAYNKMSIRVKTSRAEKEVYEKLSNSDSLTGLYNRKAVFRQCEALLKQFPDEQFVMAHIDLVRFQLYNTFFGDKAGDQLLCDIAEPFRNCSKEFDHWAYGRIEADVFCAFFPYDEKDYQKHIVGLQQFLREYRSDFLVQPKLGVYFVTDPEMSIEAMFTRASMAAKEVQPSTPYATVIYDETLERELNEKQQVINEMQTAIDEEQFKVYLQPKYSLRNNKMAGAEALVRWIHPTKGLISPAKFIPVFESNGFITELDCYMWEHVCQLLSRWQREGRPIVPVSVNISRLSMYGTSTVDFLKKLIKKYEIDPKYLKLELTESAYMDNPDEMKAQMIALREAGFPILLDDFGSGYSSLNTLRELPVDILKLDMRFLSQDKTDRRGELVISSIVRMSKLLKLAVIAEGVELQEQADFLKSVGCEYVQGFLFARPMPVAEYETLLTDINAPLPAMNQPMIDHVKKIIAETESGTYAMGMVIPEPLACLEYSNHTFFFLRANPAFYTEFNLTEEMEPASVIFKNHLDEENLRKFKDAIEESIQTGRRVKTRFTWQEKNGAQREYICSIVYEGNIGEAATLVAVFMNPSTEANP